MTRPTSAPRRRARCRVLVLEDNRERRDALRARLGDDGVVYATTVQEAIEALRQHHCRVAYLDHDVPGNQNGSDLAWWMARRLPARRRPRILLHSTSPAGALSMKLALVGFDVTEVPYPSCLEVA